MKFQVNLIYSDGEEILQDEIFDDEDEAIEHAQYLCSCAREGAEILHMSNPFENPYDEDEYEAPGFQIIEIND